MYFFLPPSVSFFFPQLLTRKNTCKALQIKATCRQKKANAIKLVHNEEMDAAEMKTFSFSFGSDQDGHDLGHQRDSQSESGRCCGDKAREARLRCFRGTENMSVEGR